MKHDVETPLKFARKNQGRFLAELKDFIRIPSVSTQPQHREDVAAAAGWLAESMRQAGLENVEVIPSAVGGHPLVYGDWLNAGEDRPTVLVYGHFDVQPVEPIELWESPPFEPTVRGDFLFARGSTDDKGQSFVHVKAVEAFLKTGGSLPVNVKFIYEGEEESGGRTLAEFLPRSQEKLAASVALVSDTGILGPDQPSIVYGLRGNYYVLMDITGPAIDLHSGEYGGGIDNPLNALGHLIAALKDPDGHILIPGFYDDVRPLSEEERTLMSRVPFDEAAWLEKTGAPRPWGEPKYTLLERLGARPTLDVHGIIGGYTGEGAKTVLPSTVHVKLSMRLVPNQEPEKIGRLFEDYVREILPPTMTVTIRGGGGAPSISDIDTPAMQAARAAYAAVFDREPVFMREGGSIPVVGQFQKHLGLETVLMGFSIPGARLHSPNENFYLPNFYRGIETAIHFLAGYGDHSQKTAG